MPFKPLSPVWFNINTWFSKCVKKIFIWWKPIITMYSYSHCFFICFFKFWNEILFSRCGIRTILKMFLKKPEQIITLSPILEHAVSINRSRNKLGVELRLKISLIPIIFFLIITYIPLKVNKKIYFWTKYKNRCIFIIYCLNVH